MGIVEGLRGGSAFSGASSTHLDILVFLTVGFFLGFSVDAFFWLLVSCIFCCSLQRQGAWCGF